MSLRRRFAAASLLLALATCAQARSFEGVVTHVTDGDSLWVRPASGGAPRQIRLQGIDAPEICQAFGVASRNALAAHVLHRRVAVASRARDGYQRVLGRVSVNGEDLGAWLVSRGLAWSDRYRHRPGPYEPQEARARAARLGLWADGTPLLPREFRKRHGRCK
ncbi:MAG TPA: thermonuclease family protein [Ramlibacter sp.]|nr:thermonuclease family protein [Ramlibacter sp.]